MSERAVLREPPSSDLQPWTKRHDWAFAPYVLTSNPPQYDARCRRCGIKRRGFAERFEINDCAGRVGQESS